MQTIMRRIAIILLFPHILSAEKLHWYGKDTQQLVVFTHPVTDLFIDEKIEKIVPASPSGTNTGGTCHRAHQGLFHEVAVCDGHCDRFVHIVMDNVIYGYDPVSGEPRSSFWVPRNRVTFFHELSDEAKQTIPLPSSLAREQLEATTLVLVLPWKKYSVGTRFVRDPEHDTKDNYGIVLFDYCKQLVKKLVVPRSCCLLEQRVTRQEARAQFVAVAHNLVDYFLRMPSQRVLPYVWGGSSCVMGYEDRFEMNGQGAWVRKGRHDPYMGYDCSELVLRLAQICGIPYYYKTTLTLSERGKELTKSDTLEAGDILWIPGHVMIIADLKNNTLIESRGYASGYGKLQRTALAESFEGIKTCAQLREALFAKRPLVRLKKGGAVDAIIPECKIFKIN